MITENHVSFDVAKLLKEKGFDEECQQYYGDYKYPCPTLQMAMKWLREVHNKHCDVSLDYILGWYIQIVDTKETVDAYDDEEMKIYHPEQDNGFESYEEACEAAIKYCLEKLV